MLKNAKVPFGLDTQTGKIFCYATSNSLPPDGLYATETGVVYDMAVLAKVLEEGKPIDEAMCGRVPATGECHWVFEGDIVNEVTAREPRKAHYRNKGGEGATS